MTDDRDDTRNQSPTQPTEAPAPNRWGDPIGDARKAELQALFERQAQWAAQPAATRGDSLFNNVPLTGADVFWLAVLALFSSKHEGDVAAAEAGLRAAPFDTMPRLNSDLSTLHLERADLSEAHLEGAILVRAHLEQATITDARLEGADLSLAHLEQAKLVGTHLDRANLIASHLEGCTLVASHLAGGNLSEAHLEGAELSATDLGRANFSDAHLSDVNLDDAHLADANLGDAHLERASLVRARLDRASLAGAYLEGAVLADAHLEGADLSNTHLEGANLRNAQLEGADLTVAHLEVADLRRAHLERAELTDAHLQGAILVGAHLEGTNLYLAHLGGTTYRAGNADLRRIREWIADFPDTLGPADLRDVFLDQATILAGARWTEPSTAHAPGPRLADVHWGGANLTVVDWERIRTLQDEREAATRHKEGRQTNKPPFKTRSTRIGDYHAAGRAYRLLFVALRNQGLAGVATNYHLRAEIMDRKALWHRRRLLRWAVSWALGTFAGYGDALGRLFLTYFSLITVFAFAFWIGAHHGLSLPTSLKDVVDPFVLSVTSFHGRGLQPHGLTANDTVTALSGLEAVFGLIVEGIFIAAFTRRVTGG